MEAARTGAGCGCCGGGNGGGGGGNGGGGGGGVHLQDVVDATTLERAHKVAKRVVNNRTGDGLPLLLEGGLIACRNYRGQDVDSLDCVSGQVAGACVCA